MIGGIESGSHEHHLEGLSFHQYNERRQLLSNDIDTARFRDREDGQSLEDMLRQRDDLDCSHPNHYLQLVETQTHELGKVDQNIN